jgi:putative PIN family toxin of toxin-antitoxin system
VKVVADTMIWVSFVVTPDGFRHRLIKTARRLRVRLFVSDYILDELERTLTGDLGCTRRFGALARRAVLRLTQLVQIPDFIPRHVPGDPNDDPIVQTALSASAHFLVTADVEILKLRKIRNVAIVSPEAFASQLAAV